MNTLTAMLLIIINNSFQKDANYDIALKLLQSRQQIEPLSIAAFAKSCHTSVASVNKFCKMLGFQSFSELKFNLNGGFNVRKEQIAFRLSKMSEQDILDSISHYAQRDFDLEQFKASIKHLAELIHQADAVELIGAYFPSALAINFQEDMINMNKLVYTSPQKHIIESHTLSDQTLILFITLTGRIYEFNKNDFNHFCQSHQNIAFISGYADFPKYSSISDIVKIPIIDDNELGNILIIEIFRYITTT